MKTREHLFDIVVDVCDAFIEPDTLMKLPGDPITVREMTSLRPMIIKELAKRWSEGVDPGSEFPLWTFTDDSERETLAKNCSELIKKYGGS